MLLNVVCFCFWQIAVRAKNDLIPWQWSELVFIVNHAETAANPAVILFTEATADYTFIHFFDCFSNTNQNGFAFTAERIFVFLIVLVIVFFDKRAQQIHNLVYGCIPASVGEVFKLVFNFIHLVIIVIDFLKIICCRNSLFQQCECSYDSVRNIINILTVTVFCIFPTAVPNPALAFKLLYGILYGRHTD